MHNKGLAVRSVLSSNGRIEQRRRRYHAPGLGGVVPVDRLIDVLESSVSLGVRELCCRIATDSGSFTRAAANLERAAQLRLSNEKLRQVVEAEGRAVLVWQEHEQLEFDWDAADCVTEQTPDGVPISRLYVGCDGFMSPAVTDAEMGKRLEKAKARRKRLPRRRGVRRRPLVRRRGADQRYKELKLVTMYDQDQSHRLVRVTHRNHKHAGKLMRQMASDLQATRVAQLAAVTDGAEWIGRAIEQNLPRRTTVIVDFFHLSQHVHETRRVVFGETEVAGHAWADQLLAAIVNEGFEAFWEKLLATRSRLRSPAKRSALDNLTRYAGERRQKMDYKAFKSAGLSIGSGPTESMCKALGRRLKGMGMRWQPANAQAMATLESLHQSDGWRGYWSTRCAVQC
jgi:Transposase